jgi:Na+/melibiose symporter-like transporter
MSIVTSTGIQQKKAAARAKRLGSLLRNRNFRLFWTGETASGFGNSVALISMPLLAVTVLHAGTFVVTALAAMSYLPWLIIGLPAGAWVDRLDRRSVMMLCDAISVVTYAYIAIFSWLGIIDTAQLLLAAFVAGAANVFFTVACQVYLPDLVTPENLVEANSKFQVSVTASNILGQGIGGTVCQFAGPAAGILINSGTFITSAFCLFGTRKISTSEPTRRPSRNIRSDITHGLRIVMRDFYLRSFCIYATVANLTYSGYLALVVIFLVKTVGLHGASVGLLMAAGSAGGVTGAMVARPLMRRTGTGWLLSGSALVTGLFTLLIPLTSTGIGVIFFALGASVMSGGISVTNVIVGSFRQAYVPSEVLGRVTASSKFLSYGITPLGALFAGALGVSVGVRPTLWIALGLYAAASTILIFPGIHIGKDLPTARMQI